MNLTPNATAAHWTSRYVGLPWVPGADGPDAFDCWGLVRSVEREHYGRDGLPRLSIQAREAPPGQWGELRALVQHSSWRAIDGHWMDGDILVMLNAKGLPHVGVFVMMDRPCLLHATGEMDEQHQPRGEVVLEPVAGLGASGFGHIDAWRFIA